MRERDIWEVIRVMVAEKYTELGKVLSLFKNSSIINSYRQSKVRGYISSHFISKSIKEKIPENTSWLDVLSAEDLFRVYCYLNYVMRCAMHNMTVYIKPLGSENGVITEYSLSKGYGFVDRTDDELFDIFDRNIRMNKRDKSDRDMLFIDKISTKGQIFKRPEGKSSPNLNFVDAEVREYVASELISRCIKEVEEKTNEKLDFEEVKSRLHLCTRYYNNIFLGVDRLKITKNKSLISGIIEEEFEEEIHREFVGVDVEGNPVYESIEGYTNNAGDILPDDTYFIKPD